MRSSEDADSTNPFWSMSKYYSQKGTMSGVGSIPRWPGDKTQVSMWRASGWVITWTIMTNRIFPAELMSHHFASKRRYSSTSEYPASIITEGHASRPSRAAGPRARCPSLLRTPGIWSSDAPKTRIDQLLWPGIEPFLATITWKRLLATPLCTGPGIMRKIAASNAYSNVKRTAVRNWTARSSFSSTSNSLSATPWKYRKYSSDDPVSMVLWIILTSSRADWYSNLFSSKIRAAYISNAVILPLVPGWGSREARSWGIIFWLWDWDMLVG